MKHTEFAYLVITSHPPSVADLQAECEFYDHCFVSFSISLSKPLPSPDTGRKVFMYGKGNYDSMARPAIKASD